MKVSYILRADKMSAAGLAPVHVVIHYDGKRLKAGVGEKCKPVNWNQKSQKFCGTFEGKSEANEYLKKLSERLYQLYRKLRGDGVAVTKEALLAVVQPVVAEEVKPAPREFPMLDKWNAFMETMRGMGFSINTLGHYKTVRNTLGRFFISVGLPELPVSAYDLAIHQQFVGYLRDVQGLADNAVFSSVKDIKSFLRHLRDERGETLALDLDKVQMRYADPVKVYLSAGDLDLLATALLPDWMMSVRDVFLFCCYTGLRYSDVAALHGGNLHQLGADSSSGRVLRFTQTKTRTSMSIYLTSAASALLDKYAGPERSGPGAKLMPVRVNTAMNRALKRVGNLAGLNRLVEVVSTAGGRVEKSAVPLYELLSMHTARHTFAVQSLLRGMPVVVLQKVLGHAHIQTTMKYAKVAEEFQHDAMRAAWDGPVAPGQRTITNEAALSGTICEVEPVAA